MQKRWLAVFGIATILLATQSHAVQICTLCSTSGDAFYGCYQADANPNYKSDTPQGVLLRAYGDVRSKISPEGYICSLDAPALGAKIVDVGVPDGAFTRVYTYSYSYVESRRAGQCFQPITRTFNSEGGVTCYQYPITIGFFNGVWNTFDEATDGLKQLKLLTNNVLVNLDIKHRLFYNNTGCGLAGTCLQDLAETFTQRSGELGQITSNRWELFWDALRGRQSKPDSSSGSIASALGGAATKFSAAMESTFQAILAARIAQTAKALSNPPTASDMAGQNARITDLADKGHKMVFVSHSQGNLFVNAAYDNLKRKYPNPYFTRIVHVAPASPSLRGSHALADIDGVINGLRLVGGVPPTNLNLPLSIVDWSGHMLVETYLDGSRPARQYVFNSIRDAVALTTTPITPY